MTPRVILGSLAISAPALASEAAAPLPDAGGLWRSVLGLALVLGLIAALGWAMRRLAPLRAGAHGPLRVVASQSLGARERVVLLEVSDQWLVVGVAPGSVRALANVPRGEVPTPTASSAHPFAALLARAGVRPNDASGGGAT